MSLSTQSLALVLTTQNKQEKTLSQNTEKHKINKLTPGKKNTQNNTKNPNKTSKPKRADPSTLARVAHMCVLITVNSCGTQYSIEQF